MSNKYLFYIFSQICQVKQQKKNGTSDFCIRSFYNYL